MRVALLLLACAFTAQAKFMEVSYDQMSTLSEEAYRGGQALPGSDSEAENPLSEDRVLWPWCVDRACDEDTRQEVLWPKEDGFFR